MFTFDRTCVLKQVSKGLAFAVMTMSLVGCNNRSKTISGTTEETFVAVTQMLEHPALNSVRDGIKDELAEAGYEAGKTLRWEWQSAKGSPVTATHIAKKYAGARPDVIVAIAPHSAKTVAAATNNTPIIFSAVTHPVGINLVKNTKRPGGNISGVSDLSPIAQQLELIQEILPDIKTLGVISSTDTDDAASLANRVNASADDLDIEIKAVSFYTDSDVVATARSLIGSVDAIYVPVDKTIASEIASIVQVGKDNQVPVFAGDIAAVEQGAIATLSFDYYDVGRQTGAMVIKVLRGNRPGDLSVEFVKDPKLSINLKAAEAMGVTIPASITSRADEILTE